MDQINYIFFVHVLLHSTYTQPSALLLLVLLGARRRVLGESLTLFGEIGAEDHISWFKAGRSREEAKQFIPMIVSTISNFVEVLPHYYFSHG
jgi:hypothetical protein